MAHQFRLATPQGLSSYFWLVAPLLDIAGLRALQDSGRVSEYKGKGYDPYYNHFRYLKWGWQAVILGVVRVRDTEVQSWERSIRDKEVESVPETVPLLSLHVACNTDKTISYESAHVHGETRKHLQTHISVNSTADIHSVTCQDKSKKDFNHRESSSTAFSSPTEKKKEFNNILVCMFEEGLRTGGGGRCEEKLASCQELTSHSDWEIRRCLKLFRAHI